jgi:hypothetical protein
MDIERNIRPRFVPAYMKSEPQAEAALSTLWRAGFTGGLIVAVRRRVI